jgi:hypothetical protein
LDKGCIAGDWALAYAATKHREVASLKWRIRGVPAEGLAACVSGRDFVDESKLELDALRNAGSASGVLLGFDNTLLPQAAHGSVHELLRYPELVGQIDLPRENLARPELAISDLLPNVSLDLARRRGRFWRLHGLARAHGSNLVLERSYIYQRRSVLADTNPNPRRRFNKAVLPQADHDCGDKCLGDPELAGHVDLPGNEVARLELPIPDLLPDVSVYPAAQRTRLGRHKGGPGAPVGAVSTPIE